MFRKIIGLFRLGGSGAGSRVEGLQASGSGGQRSAVPVTLDTSLQLSAVWACVRLLAESVASLPINVYKIDRQTGERVIAKDHPLHKLFSGKVNAWQTRQEFFETIVYQLVLMGNDFSVVERNKSGEVIALMPLMSEQMEVNLNNDGVSYQYNDGKNVKVYSDQTIWHNKLFGNGVVGLSTFQYAKQSLGIAQAAEQATTNIYENGGKPSGVLTIDRLLTPEQRDQAKDKFSGLEAGNQNRLFVLEGGMKYQQVSLSPQDIELLSSRRFQIEDIARFFGVPSVLINDTSSSTSWGSGIEQIVQGFYKLGLRPYLERYEASMKARLLSASERLEYDIEFDFNSLLRADAADRLKSYGEAVRGGIMTPNEARNKEGWSSKEGGDSLMVQQQMIPIDKIGEILNKGGTTNAD